MNVCMHACRAFSDKVEERDVTEKISNRQMAEVCVCCLSVSSDEKILLVKSQISGKTPEVCFVTWSLK